jgi:hypothetical protein
MKSQTVKTRRNAYVLTISAVFIIVSRGLADPSPDLLNSIQYLRQEAERSSQAKRPTVGTSAHGTKGESKFQWVARTVTVPASEGVSSITVFVPTVSVRSPGLANIAPVRK